MPTEMWIYLFLTFVLEIPVLYFFFRKQEKWWRIVLIGVLLSSFTWPIAMYAYNVWNWDVYLLEILISLTEGTIIKFYWNITWKKGLFIGFLMNATSFFIGQLIQWTFDSYLWSLGSY